MGVPTGTDRPAPYVTVPVNWNVKVAAVAAPAAAKAAVATRARATFLKDMEPPDVHWHAHPAQAFFSPTITASAAAMLTK
jgi:hypothetical protein